MKPALVRPLLRPSGSSCKSTNSENRGRGFRTKSYENVRSAEASPLLSSRSVQIRVHRCSSVVGAHNGIFLRIYALMCTCGPWLAPVCTKLKKYGMVHKPHRTVQIVL